MRIQTGNDKFDLIVQPAKNESVRLVLKTSFHQFDSGVDGSGDGYYQMEITLPRKLLLNMITKVDDLGRIINENQKE